MLLLVTCATQFKKALYIIIARIIVKTCFKSVLVMKLVVSLVQELGVDKVAHQTRLRQALKIITGKRTSQHPCELLFSASDNATTTTTTIPAKMTVSIIPSPTTESDTIV